VAEGRWRFGSGFSLDYARMHAERGDVLGVVGQVAKAVVEEAHARACAARRWVLNEKHILELAGLAEAHTWFGGVPTVAAELVRWVADVRTRLGL
jgi:hypothetical protein